MSALPNGEFDNVVSFHAHLDVRESVQPNVQQHTDAVLDAQFIEADAQTEPETAQPKFYTTQDIAERYPDLGKNNKPLGEGAIRTRWFNWISKVADESLLKNPAGYTQLAVDLFDDFAEQVKRKNVKPDEWVSDAKDYFAEAIQAEIAAQPSTNAIEGEFVSPTALTSALALTQNQIQKKEQSNSTQMSALTDLLAKAKALRSQLSSAEIEAAKKRGEGRAIATFGVEVEAQLNTEANLRELWNQED